MKFLFIACLLSCTTLNAQTVPVSEQAASLPVHDSNILITVRDGIELSAEIFRPAKPGKYPTLYAAGPQLFADTIPDSPLTGPVAWLVSQGFNYVLLSVRGTGRSTGEYEFMDRDEQQDHYEVIEWIASQQWSDGQVAGIGAGFYGNSQWQMAVQNPPHLSCIAPGEAVLDLHTDWAWQGGLANTAFVDDFEQKVRLPHAYPQRGSARHLSFDLFYQQHLHALPDNWWDIRSVLSSLDQIRIPVLQFGSWQNALQPWLNALNRTAQLPSATHTFVSTRSGLLQDRDFLNNELLPYYHWCFSGRTQTGPALQPKVRYQQVNGNTTRASSSWPPANINYTELLLKTAGNETDTGILSLDASVPGSNRTTLGNNDRQLLSFLSRPLANDLDFAGPLQAELYLSSSDSDTAVQVELYEIPAPVQQADDLTPETETETNGSDNGTDANPAISNTASAVTSSKAVLISSASLRASARGDEALTLPDNSYQYSQASPQPLYPGRIYRLGLDMGPIAWHMKAGSSLLLTIRPTADAALTINGQTDHTDTLYHTGQFLSRVWLPLSADSRLVFVPEAQTPDQSLFNNIFIMNSFQNTATVQE